MRYVRRALLFGLLVAMALWQEPAKAATCVATGTLNAYAHETITVSTTSVGFNAVLYQQGSGDAQSALVTVAADSIRWFADGTIAPTTTVGHLASAGTPIEICGFSNIKNFRMIRVTTDSTVTVSYFR